MRESADSFSTFSCFIVEVEVIERVDIVAILVVVNIMTAVKVYLRCCCCYGYRHAGDLILHCSSCTIETFLGTYCKHLRNWEQRVASWSSRWSLHSHIQTHVYIHTHSSVRSHSITITIRAPSPTSTVSGDTDTDTTTPAAALIIKNCSRVQISQTQNTV